MHLESEALHTSVAIPISMRRGPHAHPYRRNVSDRFTGMTCVLCPNPSKGVGEHVWPRWLIQEFHGDGPFTTEKGGVAYTKRDGVTPVTAVALPGVHVPMCESCNTELNRSIEEPAKPVIRQLLPWSPTHAWPAISTNEAAALARWFLKIGLLAGHPEAVHDNPHVQRDEDFPRFERVDPAWLDWMRTGSAPPADFSVYVAKRSVMGEQPWQGETQRIFLPTRVVVAERELRFATRSFGVRGLDVTMVWHPGWPILHPLEEAGRVAALWPNPAPVDFDKLPEVHPKEFSFTVGLGTRRMSEAGFKTLTQEPLSVATDPFVQFFGDTTQWPRE